MSNAVKKRAKSSQKISDMRFIFALRWKRLSWERTDKADRNWLYRSRNSMRANFSLEVPWSDLDVVKTICERAEEPITIKYLSPELGTIDALRGTIVFGYAWDEIDKVAANYENMYWWIADRGLTMDTILPTPPPEDFDQVAGRLLSEIRQRFPNASRLSREQYSELAARLDKLEKFKPREVLPRKRGKELADWNQKSGKGAILSFSQAIEAKQPKWIRREILKRLYRAIEKFDR